MSGVSTPYALFIDDDMELTQTYIESMESLLDEAQDVVIATGELAADGARNDTGFTHVQAETLLAEYKTSGKVARLQTAISCNLFVRTSLFEKVRFDERLPLYGWLEDFDFCTRAKQYGAIVENGLTCSVHLGVTFGRTSGIRFGYSQIANPFYLWRKSGDPSLSRVLVNFWLRLLIANIAHSVLPGNSGRVDRPGRLKGNMLAFVDLFQRRLDPERILSL